jgi:2-desacetyl-2-hydroxyethyl bacteriochlorophyllide A dehydrogenase
MIWMLQAILYGAGDLRLEERPLDYSRLERDEVYVETEVSALSTGTDLGNYLGRSLDVPGAPDYPRWVGYSNVGIVRAAGADVKTPQVGSRVFSMKPHQSAYIAKHSELLVDVPPAVSSEQASLAYLTQLGVAAMHQVRYQPSESVAVVGLGVIGLASIGAARAMGARTIAVANSRLRADAAMQVGAHEAYVSGEDTMPSGVNVVILTANTWEAFRASVDMADYGGRVAIVGFPGRGQPPPQFNPIDQHWMYLKQLTLMGAGQSQPAERRQNLENILGWMASGALQLEPIITHRLPAERMREAYELARLHSKELMAAVFDWRPNRDSATFAR